MDAARAAISALFRPQHTTWAAENTIEPGSRPSGSHAARTRSNCRPVSAAGQKGMLNSWAKVAASRGVRLGPPPPTMTGGPGACTGFGSAGLSDSR
jgi:hypothetical protein